MSNHVSWGESAFGWSWPRAPEKELAKPPPEPPVFDQAMADMEARIRKRVGKVRFIRDLDHPHPEIRKLLESDDKRRAKIAEWSYWATARPVLFESPFERRRLKLLNSLFLGLSQAGCKGSFSGDAARGVQLIIGEHRIQIGLDHPDAKPNRQGEASVRAGAADRLKLTAPGGDPAADDTQSWVDDETGKLEQRLTEIVVQIILAGEASSRRAAQRGYEYAVTLRAEMQVELEKRRAAAIEAERKRREEEARRQREQLIGQSRDWRQASDLRAFVAQVQAAASPNDDFGAWSAWALGVADAIDPLRNGAFTHVVASNHSG